MRSSPRNRTESCFELIPGEGVEEVLLTDFVHPALRAIPPAMAHQLGVCRVSLVKDLGEEEVASRWTSTARGLEISLAVSGRERHDVALELLTCLGQALWAGLSGSRRKEYWLLLDAEIGAGASGEIDEDALEAKRSLMSSRASAASGRLLERYGCASFAATAAEYIHSLWHDVTIRSGADFLPAGRLRRRLELLSAWYPPGRGYQLFPRDGGVPHEE